MAGIKGGNPPENGDCISLFGIVIFCFFSLFLSKRVSNPKEAAPVGQENTPEKAGVQKKAKGFFRPKRC